MATSVEIMNPSTEVLETAATSVFQPGKLTIELIPVDRDTNPTYLHIRQR
jgi:chlorophyllase